MMKRLLPLITLLSVLAFGCETNEPEQERHMFERPLTGDWVSGAMGGAPAERQQDED